MGVKIVELLYEVWETAVHNFTGQSQRVTCLMDFGWSSDRLRTLSSPGVELRVTSASSFDLAMNTPSCLCASMITFAPPFSPPPRPLNE